MLAATLYYIFYLGIVTISTIMLSAAYSRYTNERLEEPDHKFPLIALLLCIGLALFIGNRPLSYVFVDTMNYNIHFNHYATEDWYFKTDTDNLIFDNIEYYLAAHYYDITSFFLVIAFVYFGGMFVAFRKMFPKDVLYALVIYLGAFSTFSYGTNGIKAGAAASLFLCALAYKDKPLLMALFCALSYGFHHSMVLPIVALLTALIYKKTNIYLYVWLICILLSAAHVTFFQTLFNEFADEGGQGYLSYIDGEAAHGFRLDFIIYSAFPVLTWYYAVYKHGYQSATYQFLLNTYLILNSVWMLCMYASFTNRIAYLSWLMLPVVLVYPFFDKAFVDYQYRKLNFVAWGHLGFTLAMYFIYYGMIK